jgi:cytochrome b561
MPIKNTPLAYGSVAKAFHWLMALLILGMLAMGLYMDGMPTGPDQYKLIGLHKSFGTLVLMVVIFRLGWKAMNTVPLLPTTLNIWEKRLAHAGHAVLYLLMFAMPLSGWAMSSAAGFPVSFFGLFVLPDIVAPNHALKETFEDVHEALAWALIAMIILHVLAALLHHFYYKNNILRRMLPFTKEEKYAQDSDTMVGC